VRLAAQSKEVPVSASLSGCTVLIVEDEPLIALDIVRAFERAGAEVVTARTLADASRFAEGDGLSAAVLDFGLGDGDANALCAHLAQRDIPFILHSGYSRTSDACNKGIVIPKPAIPDRLVHAVGELRRRH
jgi:DNA-binding response OmpR family regulator